MRYNNDFEKYAIAHLNIGSNLLHQYNEVMCDRVNSNSLITNNSLTPYVLEERPMRATQLDIFSRLLIDRIIWISGAISQSMSPIVQAQLMYLDNNETRDINVYLDTPGGSVDAGLSIIDTYDYVKSDIATLNTGGCASMGSVLLSAGKKGKRASLMFSKVMTHMVSHGNQGNIQDTRINQYEAEQANYILFKILAKNCDRTFEEIHEISRYDRWFNSDESVEFGLVDRVIGVRGERSITNLLEGFDEYYDLEFGKTVKKKFKPTVESAPNTTKKRIVKK